MAIVDTKGWNECVKNNSDPYGKAAVDVAREVMRLLDTPEYSDFDTHKIICDADENSGAGGITGFMAGCVANIVSQVHSRGEEFRRKWNGDHGVKKEDDKGGVVNPAILTVTTKES
jgi:hypothetical protein